MKPLIDTIPTDGEPDIITAIIDRRGGKRPNAGRKPSQCKTVVLSFRVPNYLVEHIKYLVKSTLEELK